ncbi:MAG: hypothetical protein QM730_30285 [Anaerolineales bacterium]
MNKKVILLGAIIALLISACGAGEPPVPTTDPNSIVATAQAAAFTMIAQTQAAIPTATFTETPTATPVSTDTPIPSPTLAATLAALPTATTGSSVNANGDPCYHPIEVGAGGPNSVLRIKNKTKGLITVFIYLYKPNAFGECGYMGFDVYKGESQTITSMPRGYFAVSAYTNNRKNTAYGTAIISDDHLIDFEVYDDWIKVIYP